LPSTACSILNRKNDNYGHVTERQAPRAFRAAVRVSF
jgi:hypothetical protein